MHFDNAVVIVEMGHIPKLGIAIEITADAFRLGRTEGKPDIIDAFVVGLAEIQSSDRCIDATSISLLARIQIALDGECAFAGVIEGFVCPNLMDERTRLGAIHQVQLRLVFHELIEGAFQFGLRAELLQGHCTNSFKFYEGIRFIFGSLMFWKKAFGYAVWQWRFHYRSNFNGAKNSSNQK